MSLTSTMLILVCLSLTISFAKSTQSQDIHAADLEVAQVDGRTGVHISTSRDPSSRMGLPAPPSANSSIWAPIMTSRKAPSADDPSINEIDSADYFPSHTVNISTATTEKPNIVWAVILSEPNNKIDDSVIDWLTTTTTTKAPDTRVAAVPEHPTSVAEFFNAQLSLLDTMWTNVTKLTDHVSKEITNTVTSVFDYLWELFVLIVSKFISEITRRAEIEIREIEYDTSEM